MFRRGRFICGDGVLVDGANYFTLFFICKGIKIYDYIILWLVIGVVFIGIGGCELCIRCATEFGVD